MSWPSAISQSFVSALNGIVDSTLHATQKACAKCTQFVSENSQEIASATLGAAGGYLFGVSPQLGALQGLTCVVINSSVIKPMAKFISENSGPGENQFHDKTAKMLYVAGLISTFALPIAITNYTGGPTLQAIGSFFSTGIQGWLVSPSIEKYSCIRGFFVNIAPAAVAFRPLYEKGLKCVGKALDISFSEVDQTATKVKKLKV